MAKEMAKETDKKVLELTTLYEVAKLASSSLDLDSTLRQILHTLSVFLEMKRATLTLLDPVAGTLRVRASYGLTKSEMRRGTYRVGEGVTGKVFETGVPFIVPDVGKEPLFLNRTASRGNIRKENISFIGIPVKVRRTVIGVLSVDRLFSLKVDYQEDVRLLGIVASIIGQAVALNRMVESEKEKLAGFLEEFKDDSLTDVVHEIELKSLKDALALTGWRQAAAARLLGITPRQMGYTLKKYGIAPQRKITD